MTPSLSPLRGLLTALLAAALFGVNGSVSSSRSRAACRRSAWCEVRSLGSAVLLVAIVAVTRPRSLKVSRSELRFLVMAGIVGIALVQWFYFVAIARLPVGIALLVEYLAPVMVVLWVRFVRRESVRARMWAALALAVAGLAVVAQVWQGMTLDGIGLLAALAAAASLAAYYLTGERGLTQRDEMSLAAYIFVAQRCSGRCCFRGGRSRSTSWATPFAAGADGGHCRADVGARRLDQVLGTVVPYVLVLAALRSLGPARTGLVGMTEPVLAALVAWVVLAEALTWVQLVGGVVVLTGVVLAEHLACPHARRDAARGHGSRAARCQGGACPNCRASQGVNEMTVHREAWPEEPRAGSTCGSRPRGGARLLHRTLRLELVETVLTSVATWSRRSAESPWPASARRLRHGGHASGWTTYIAVDDVERRRRR